MIDLMADESAGSYVAMNLPYTKIKIFNQRPDRLLAKVYDLFIEIVSHWMFLHF